MPVDPGELSPWRDPDDILESLGKVKREDVSSLSAALAVLLDHEDVDVREEAARTLFVTGKHRVHRGRAVELLQHDQETAVRTTAAFGVASTSDDATRADDVRLLISIVEDENENTEVRRSAYEALLILFRRPAFPAANKPFKPQDDIDWRWLRGISNQFGTPGG